jgi:hypothetical protein
MKLTIEKGFGEIHGWSPADRQMIDTLNQGTYACEIKQIRNVKYHRKFFSMINMAFDTQDEFKMLNTFLDRVKLLAGHYTLEEMELEDGTRVMVKRPSSISFARMEEADFERFYSRVVDALIEHYCPGSTPEEMDEAARKYIAYT